MAKLYNKNKISDPRDVKMQHKFYVNNIEYRLKIFNDILFKKYCGQKMDNQEQATHEKLFS